MTIDLTTAASGPFQYVPVPNEHVPAVISFLAHQMSSEVSGAPASALTGEPSPVVDDSWSDAELGRLLAMETETSVRLARVLALLAGQPGQEAAKSTRELAEALGLSYHQMKNHPTQVKRSLRKHFPQHSAPWSAAPGPQLSPAKADELFYWLTPERADQINRLLG